MSEIRFHILAVDDSLPDRKLIEIKTSSFQVTTVDSGSKALEFLGLQDHEDSPISVQADQLEVAVNMIIYDQGNKPQTGRVVLRKK
uniref:Uncharacterized protein n=1 Tax=Leersia perrieri TaxID=77586 RepID=A0A0D9Y0B5_9ORYZ